MTNVTINEETGLPELPEGYFWEIIERSDDDGLVYEFVIADATNTQKEWVRKQIQSSETLVLTDYYIKSRWLYHDDIYIKVVDEISMSNWRLTGNTRNYSETVKEPLARFWPLSAWEIEAVKTRTEYEVEQARSMFKSTLKDEAAFDWSPKSIQQVAVQTYRNWQYQLSNLRKAEERQQKIDAVLGSYPPKSISVVD